MLINQIFLFDNEDGDTKMLIKFKDSIEFEDFDNCISQFKFEAGDDWKFHDIVKAIKDKFEVENINYIQECETYCL